MSNDTNNNEIATPNIAAVRLTSTPEAEHEWVLYWRDSDDTIRIGVNVRTHHQPEAMSPAFPVREFFDALGTILDARNEKIKAIGGFGGYS